MLRCSSNTLILYLYAIYFFIGELRNWLWLWKVLLFIVFLSKEILKIYYNHHKTSECVSLCYDIDKITECFQLNINRNKIFVCRLRDIKILCWFFIEMYISIYVVIVKIVLHLYYIILNIILTTGLENWNMIQLIISTMRYICLTTFA